MAYPLYHSARRINSSEEDDMRKVLKYWCLLIFVQLFNFLLELVIYE